MVAEKGVYFATRPSPVAAASPAPGPTAWTQVPAVAKLSPSRPSRAREADWLDAELISSKPMTRHPAVASPATEACGVQAVASGSASRPAASPADTVDQPSVGHVAGPTARTRDRGG